MTVRPRPWSSFYVSS